jgi:hypothetical protein
MVARKLATLLRAQPGGYSASFADPRRVGRRHFHPGKELDARPAHDHRRSQLRDEESSATEFLPNNTWIGPSSYAAAGVAITTGVEIR